MARNIYCPHYADCLDNAIQEGAADFDCSNCSHRDERAQETLESFFGCCLLLTKIFAPEIYEEFVNTRGETH
jgi:hypothetical protein